MGHFITAVITAIMGIITFLVVSPLVIAGVTGTDTGSMLIKGFFVLILASFAIVAPLIGLVFWWTHHDKEHKEGH